MIRGGNLGLAPATVTIGTPSSISGISLLAPLPDDGNGNVTLEYGYYDFYARAYSMKITATITTEAVQFEAPIGSMFHAISNRVVSQINGLEPVPYLYINDNGPVYIIKSQNASLVYADS